MKKMLLLLLATIFIDGCSSTLTTAKSSSVQYTSDKDRHDITNEIKLKHDFEVKFVGSLKFSIDEKCSHSRAVYYVRKKNLADELGSITMYEEITTNKEIITEHYYNGTSSVIDKNLKYKCKCFYSALGFKIVQKEKNEENHKLEEMEK